MVGRHVTLLLLLLVLAPAVFGYSGTPRLLWNNNQVTTIAPNAQLPNTVLKITLTNDFSVCSTERCTVGISAPGIEQSFDVGRECPGLNCTTRPYTLSTPTTPYNVTITMQVGSRRIAPIKQQLPLIIDATTPRVTNFRTGYCEGEECYIGNVESPFTVTFEDTVTSFNYKLVFLGADRRGEFKINSCTGKTCSGVIRGLACRQDETFTVQLVQVSGVSSREDAQNPVAGSLSQRLICRTDAPQLLAWKPPTSDGPLPVPFSTGSVTAEAKVRVFGGVPNATVNTTLINNISLTRATCVEDSEEEHVFVCKWQIRNLNNGTFDLDFKIADAVGNYILAGPENKAVRVSVLYREAGTNQRFFTGEVKAVSPEELNRMVIDLARANFMPYPMYVTYELQRAGNKPNARVVRQELKQCWTKLPNETNYTTRMAFFSLRESSILYPSQEWNKQNRLDLQIRASRQDMARSDVFNAKCQIDLVVSEGLNVYTTPNAVNLTFDVKLRESPLGQPGQVMVEKIQREEEKVTSGTAKTIRQLERYRQQADKICQVGEALTQVNQVVNTVSGLSTGLCSTGWGAAVGGPLKNTFGSMNNQLGSLLNEFWHGENKLGGTAGTTIDTAKLIAQPIASNNALVGGGGFLKQVCRQVNCRVSADVGGSNPQFNDANFAGMVGNEVLSDINVADPQASLTGAVFTMCAGGVIYNMQKYQAIDCGYIQCLKDQSLYGHSLTACDLGRNYRMCTQFYGEVGELPYARVFKNVMGNLNGILKNLPALTTRFATNRACARYKVGTTTSESHLNCYDWGEVACTFGDAIFTTLDNQKQSKQAMQGIRDTAGAQQALDLCNAVVKNERPNQYVDRAANRLLGNLAAQQQDSRERAQSGGELNPLQQVDVEYMQRTGQEPPTTYTRQVAIQGTIDDADPNEGTITVGHQTYPIVTQDPQTGIITARMWDPNNYREFEIDFTTSSGVYSAQDVERMLTSSEFITAARDGYVFTRTVKRNGQDVQVVDFDAARAYATSKQTFAALESQPVTTRQGTTTVNAVRAMGDYERRLDDKGNCESQSCRDALKRLTEAGIKPNADGTYTVEVRDAQGKVTGTKTITEQEMNMQRLRERQNFNRAVSVVSSYAAKYLYDKGYLQWFQLSGWADTIPAFGDVDRFADNYLNAEQFKQNLCNDLNYDIRDNDEGAVFQAGTFGVPQIVATFGSERRELTNTTGTVYLYTNLVHVTNPQRPRTPQTQNVNYNYELSVVLTGLDPASCRDCPQTLSLTNNAAFNLTEGSSFSNGEGPKTRLLVVEGKYSQMCIRFDKRFPDPRSDLSKSVYCRTISERAFERGSPVAPPELTQNTGKGRTGGSNNAPTTPTVPGTPPPNPLEGWS